MSETFKIELVSPERLLMSEEVEQVIIPGAEGDFAVLYGHAPILSSIRPGILRILGGKSGDKEYFVRGGFAEARPDGLDHGCAAQADQLPSRSRERDAARAHAVRGGVRRRVARRPQVPLPVGRQLEAERSTRCRPLAGCRGAGERDLQAALLDAAEGELEPVALGHVVGDGQPETGA